MNKIQLSHDDLLFGFICGRAYMMSGWRRRYGDEAVEMVKFTELGIAPAAIRPCSSPASSSSEGGMVLTGPGGAIVAGLGFRHIAILLQAGLL